MPAVEELVALFSGGGGFDPVRMRNRLLSRFGGEEGLADWLFDLAESPDTSPATRAKCADIILAIMSEGAGAALNVNVMSTDELKRMATRIAANARTTGTGLRQDSAKAKEPEDGQ